MKNKIIVSSILTIALCLSMIAGSTFALFTSESKVDIAVTSGTLDVDAVINNDLQLSSLGVAQTGTFANGGTATLTGEKLTLDKLTPGDKATFSITVTNNSNVAMNYRFVWSVEGDLYPFLTATVDGVALVNNSTPYTLWDTSVNTKTFAVVVELPQGVDNDAQNKTANISFKVEAVQGNVDILDNLLYKTDENGNKVISEIMDTLPEELNILEGTVRLPNKMLQGNTTVKEVVIPATITSFGGTANATGTGASGGFFNGSAVEKVTLPEGLTEIPVAAFNGANNLKEVNIPTTVTKVGINSFAYAGLETLTVPATITEIGYGAFRGMANLETVVIETGANIPIYAFRECASLRTVIITNPNVTFGDGTRGMIFTNKQNGDGSAITIYVPTQEVADRLLAADTAAKDYGGYTIVVGDPRVNNAEDLKDAIVNGGDVILTDDVVVNSAITTTPDGSTNEAYGNKVGVVQYGGVLDGDGNTISSNNGGYVVVTHGGTIKNLVVNSGDRGIVTYAPTEDVIIDNVIVDGPGYGINSTEHGNVDIIVTNSTVNGWTSLAGFNHAYFTNCKLGENTAKVWQGYGYDRAYDRLFRPYCNATLTNCELEEGYYIDLSALGADCEIVLDNCTVNGVVLTADNYANYITIELPSGRTLADCVVFR